MKWIFGGALFIIFLLVSTFSYSFYYIHKKRQSLYASVNPDYVEYEPDDWEVERDDVKYDSSESNSIGKGNYGVVYKGEYRKKVNDIITIIKVAVKTSSLESDAQRNRFLQEASTMKKIKCHHVISLVGVVSKGIPVLVLMEMCENGDLKSYLRRHRPKDDQESLVITAEDNNQNRSLKNNGNNNGSGKEQRITFEQILRWAIEIADGMAYLSENRFVHRDLASRNCLLSADLTAKVGDFGMAKDVYPNNYYKKCTATELPVRWCSPESLRDGVSTTKSDVWSYGIVLYEMITLGSQPYQGLTNDQVIQFLINKNGRLEMPENGPRNLYNIMEECWKSKPEDRPAFVKIIPMILPI